MRPPTHRPRNSSTRSRRQRIAAGAVLATTSLLGTYLAAIRPQPTYAAPNTGSDFGQALIDRSTVSPSAVTVPTCAAADVTVSTENDLRSAILASQDDSVICVDTSFTVATQLVIDDTALTIVGSDQTDVTLTGAGSNRLFDVTFAGTGKTVAFSNFTMSGGQYASGSGGALRIGDGTLASQDDTVVISGMSFTHNRASDDGGAIQAYDLASLQIIDSTIVSNAAQYDGGAVSALRVTNVDIANSTFTGNRALSGFADGAAIWADDIYSVFEVTDSTFANNVAGNRGGAISVEGATDGVAVNNSSFTSNSGSGNGGAVYVGDADLLVANSAFTGNSSLSFGGAVSSRITSRTTVIRSSTFTANNAPFFSGGGVYARNIDVSHSAFIDNYAGQEGGGIYSAGLTAIHATLIQGNDAAQQGAGLYSVGAYSSTSTISDSSFINNGDDTPALEGGGLFHWNLGPIDVTNSTFIGNSARWYGAGMYLKWPTSVLDDSISYVTIAANQLTGTSTKGAGIYVGGAAHVATVSVYNSIITNNDDSAGIARDIFVDTGSTGVLRNSVITSAASTNIDDSASFATGDPLLAALTNNGGPHIGDDSLQYLPTAIPAWNSPAVGLADAALTPAITTTQIGSARTGNVSGAMNASAQPTPPPPPPPTPTYPPSAPLNVVGVGEDASATIAWTAPASAGSSPITEYQAVLSPGGATCSVQGSESSCTITGLTNGTEYTATVRALNGVGWGPYSSASEPFTPQEPTPPVTGTIVITGARAIVNGKPGAIVLGVTTNLVGATVQARVKLAGQGSYYNGSTRVVEPNGTFQWQRIGNKKTYVFFVADDGADDGADGGQVRSNRVIIPAN